MPIENCVVDRNGDGVITPDDRYLYKNPTPPVTMGLSSRVEYKKFDLGMSFRANLGNYVFNDVLRGSSNVGETGAWVQQAYMGNHLKDAMDRNWQTWELRLLCTERFFPEVRQYYSGLLLRQPVQRQQL